MKEIRRLIKAFGYSFDGLKSAVVHPAFRLECVAAALLLPSAFFITGNGVERALLCGSVLLVLIVELLNSAVEATIDRISLEQHPLSKQAKDLGSAAVLVSLVNAGLIWLIILSGIFL